MCLFHDVQHRVLIQGNGDGPYTVGQCEPVRHAINGYHMLCTLFERTHDGHDAYGTAAYHNIQPARIDLRHISAKVTR